MTECPIIKRGKFILIGIFTLSTLMILFYSNANAQDYDSGLSKIELLGKYVFFDKISSPSRMACVTCHDPATGGTGSIAGINLHQVAITGANPHTVGNLKPPANAYASLIPPLKNCPFGIPGLCGGNFWNGRAEGNASALFPENATRHIGREIFYDTSGAPLPRDVSAYARYFGPTADQALNPMPNPVEQNIDRQAVCQHVASSKYATLYEQVWGVELDCGDDPVAEIAPDVELERAYDISFKRLMLAVCAWQASPDLNSFSSKRDKALAREIRGIDVDDTPGGFPLVGFTEQENLGHDLFYGIASPLNPGGKNAGCSFCHSDNPGVDNGEEKDQLYADDGYHNIGTPRNPEIPTGYNADGSIIDPDLGLAGLTGIAGQIPENCIGFNPNCDHRGFFKTPTIRNVDKRKGKGFTKSYTHNGWFKSMESIVHFYNTALIGGESAGIFGITQCPEGIETEKEALANNCWPVPAYDTAQVGSPTIGAVLGNPPFIFGDLKLTLDEEAAIVAYMQTLTDEHTPKAPTPYKETKAEKK